MSQLRDGQVDDSVALRLSYLTGLHRDCVSEKRSGESEGMKLSVLAAGVYILAPQNLGD